MTTKTNLNDYINTRNITFNRFAMKLYLENTRQRPFEQNEEPLEIFRYICDQMIGHGGNFFSFVEEFETFICQKDFTLPQYTLLYSNIRSYLKAISANRMGNNDYEYYYESYLGYFAMLDEMVTQENTKNKIAATDIPTILSGMVHHQMLRLSTDLDTLPVAQKAKVITTLYKTMPANNPPNSPAKPA